MQAIDFSELIGVPFAYLGRDPRAGLDCWGLAVEVFRRHGIELKDYAISGAQGAELVNATIDGERGDWSRWDGAGLCPFPAIVAFRFNCGALCNHVGVHIGDGRFIHSRERIGANIDRIDNPAWNRRIEGIYVPRLGAIQC